MTRSEQAFEEAIGAAGAQMPEPIVASVLRHLVNSRELRGAFHSMDVVDFIEGYNMDLPEALAIIRLLESRGQVRITARAGVDAGYTQFELTPRGIADGSPRSGRGLISLVGSTGGNTFLYAVGLFGVGTGVLGLSSLFANLSGREWSESVQAVLHVWNSVVHQPLAVTLSSPFRLLGWHGLPAWLVDYVALGILVVASSMRARQVVDIEVETPVRRLNWIGRVVGAIFMLAIWPYLVFYEVVILGALVFAYVRRPTSVDSRTRSVMPPDRVIARWITFTLPFVIFVVLLLMDAVAT